MSAFPAADNFEVFTSGHPGFQEVSHDCGRDTEEAGGSTGPYLNVAQNCFRDLLRLLLSTLSVDDPLPPARIAGLRQSRRQEVPMTQTQAVTPLRRRMLDDMRLR